MEEETTPSPDYLKGFNEGYTIAKDMPELADRLSSIKGDGDRLQGLQDGRKEYILDKAKELRPDWLKEKPTPKDRGTERSKGKDRER
jgi:hypothetical protein